MQGLVVDRFSRCLKAPAPTVSFLAGWWSRWGT